MNLLKSYQTSFIQDVVFLRLGFFRDILFIVIASIFVVSEKGDSIISVVYDIPVTEGKLLYKNNFICTAFFLYHLSYWYITAAKREKSTNSYIMQSGFYKNVVR